VSQKKWSPVIFLLPAVCDLGATSLMYVGLGMTYASVFQMLRGSVVIFTGILSMVFLKQKLFKYHWLGMFFVLTGLAFVGVASMLSGSSGSNAKSPLLGDIFVIAAQIIVAVQMVIEEKMVVKYDVPALQAVGWEGIFGFCIMSCLLVIFYYIPGNSAGNHFESAPDAIYQLLGSKIIMLATFGNIGSIAFFNFFGISVTKAMSATTRTVLDSIRTFVIWIVSLAIGWQDFQYLQVIGFVLLLFGTCVYNRVFEIPGCRPPVLPLDAQETLIDSTIQHDSDSLIDPNSTHSLPKKKGSVSDHDDEDSP